MEAPRVPYSSDNLTFKRLEALANLGASPDIDIAKLTSHQYGFVVRKTEPGYADDFVDPHMIKELLQQVPELAAEGKISKEFYQNVMEGIKKLQFQYKENKEIIQYIAKSIFEQSKSTFDQKAVLTSQLNVSKNKLKTETAATNQASGIQLEGQLPEIQKQAIDTFGKLVHPNYLNKTLELLDNLSFIETPQELALFTELVDTLILRRNDMAEDLRKGIYHHDEEERKPFYQLAADVGKIILMKPENVISDERKNELIHSVNNLLEQTFQLNTQSAQDPFAGAYNANRAVVTRHVDRSNVYKKNLADFSADEKKLVLEGFQPRGPKSSLLWQRAEWRDLQAIPTENNLQTFISGTYHIDFAVPGGKVESGLIKFDLSPFGELTQKQSEIAMDFIQNRMFATNPKPFPEELNFLADRTVPGKGSAKEELIKLADSKRTEMEYVMARTHFKVNNPDLLT